MSNGAASHSPRARRGTVSGRVTRKRPALIVAAGEKGREGDKYIAKADRYVLKDGKSI